MSARADFTSSGSDTTGWSVDRYAPNSFTSSTAPDASTAFATTISYQDSSANRPSGYSSTFYNTQGYKQSVNGVSGTWYLSEDLYITSSMLTGTAGPMSSELWGGTGNGLGSQSGFYCFSFLSGVDSRSATASASTGSMLGVFDDTTGLWSYYSTAGLTAGWSQISVAYNGSTVDFFVNGNLIASQGSAVISQDPDIATLDTAYIEDYNFYGGSGSGIPATGDTVVYRKDITAMTAAPVPEPSTLALASLGGFTILFGLKRRR